MKIELYHGDCLEILPTLIVSNVNAVVTDPPYGINTKSDGQGKLNPWADRINAAFWYREWLDLCRQKISNKGCIWSFLNWRSLVTFQKASADLNFPIESLLVWDKCWIGPGGLRGLRPSYEMVALWVGDNFAISDRSIPDIRRSKWSSIKPNGHPAEKPLDLVKWLIEISTKSGDLILDPFMGSGTTGVACVQTGRNFIGIEIDEHYFNVARRRIEQAQQQMRLLLEGGT